MLNNSLGIAVKYETLLHPADYNLMNKELGGGWSQIYNTGSITPFKCIQVYIHHLMRIVCEWITLKADGRSPEIFLVHFWGMPSSHEFIVSDEMILTKSREIR